jgi:hypothetical protein
VEVIAHQTHVKERIMDKPNEDRRKAVPGSTDPFDFDAAVEAIRRAAEVLARPASREALTAIQDAVKAVTAIQDAVKAVAVQDAVKAVAVQDAVKAVAVQDAVKAVAVQDAVKAVAGIAAVAQDSIRSVINEEVARAAQLIREAAAAPQANARGKKKA